jgi:hypothetical protein
VPQNLPAESGSNPFEEIGNQAARRIIGQLLKFSKGDYLYGAENDELPMGSKLIANMDQLLRGWIKWADNKPAEQVMGLVSEGFKIPKRDTLGDQDESEWELDDRGQPRDPWQETYYLVVRLLDKDGKPTEGNDGLYTFTTASTGGKDAIIDLCSKYGKWMRMRPNDYPVITLDMEKYNHPNKQYGVIKKPKFLFNVKKDWMPKDQFGSIDDVPPTDDGAEDMPF